MSHDKKELKNIFKSAEVISYKEEAAMRSRAYIILALFGLFLSAFVYVTTDNIIKTLIDGRMYDLRRETIRSHFSAIELYTEQIDALAARLNAMDALQWQALIGNQGNNPVLDGLNPFNFVAIYQENGLQKSTKLLERNTDASSDLFSLQAVAINQNAFASVVQQPRFTADETQIISNKGLLDKLNQLDNANDQAMRLVFIKPLAQRADGTRSWVIAEENIADIFNQKWEQQYKNIEKISIREMATDRVIYKFSDQGNRPESEMHPEQMQEIVFGGSRWSMSMLFGKDDLVIILENVPFLALLMGFFFTAISSFLASAQLKQEGHIKKINHVLEEKNKALESEMDKREKLNWDLKKSEEENLALINSISDIIFETDSKGNLAFVNAAWNRITGFDVNQSRGKNLFNMIHPDDQLDEVANFEQLVKGQKSAYRSFTRLRGIDGTFRAIELSVSMVRRSSEGIVHVVGSITDVEERRRAEQALGEAEKKYRTIVENAAWGIYQMTPEGVYLSVNPAMIDILGYDNAEDMLHSVHNAHEQVYGNKAERRAFLREVEVSGAINAHETRVLDKNGQPLWVSENIRAVKDDENNLLYYEGSFEDITDRKESDILLRDAKMHSDMANRAKSEFLTNMSHELRTPLNAIIGFSEIIKTEAFGPVGHESYKEYVNEIYDGGKKLLNIINEILDISRIEVRARELNESTVEIPDIMATCVSLLDNKAHTNQIEIMNMLDNVPAIVAEERAMKQIFTNILSNAIKFTPRGGRVTIRNEMTAAGDLNISFADTGVGLDADEIKKALSAFGQVGSSLDQDNAGTGLGLTLVKALVELHDGKLDIFSQKGMGTTVTVKIPAKRIIGHQAGSPPSGAAQETAIPAPQETAEEAARSTAEEPKVQTSTMNLPNAGE